MIMPQFSIKKSCPFCLSMPAMVKESLDHGNGHGYPGNFTYSVQCTNQECHIQPRTHEYDDIYRSEEEAIKMAIHDWEDRKEPSVAIPREPYSSGIDMRELGGRSPDRFGQSQK